MQVNKQNIQRPTLFQVFFDKLITYSNEVIEYIQTTTSKSVTSHKVKKLSILNNLIKTSIKTFIKNTKNILIHKIKKIYNAIT